MTTTLKKSILYYNNFVHLPPPPFFRCDSGSSPGSRVGHGRDSHTDCVLCLPLEEQVFIFFLRVFVCLFLGGGWFFVFFFFFALLTLLVSGRKKTSEGTYDLPHLDSTGTSSPCRTAQFAWMCFVDLLLHLCASVADWWKSMKQLLPSKMVETEDSVRYSSSEVSRLTGRGVVPGLHAEPAGKCCRLQ